MASPQKPLFLVFSLLENVIFWRFSQIFVLTWFYYPCSADVCLSILRNTLQPALFCISNMPEKKPSSKKNHLQGVNFNFEHVFSFQKKRLLVLYSESYTRPQQLLGVQKVHNYSRRQLIFCKRYTLSISKFDEFATTKTEKLANCNYWFTGSSAFIFLLHFLNLLTYLQHAKKYLVLFW